MRRFSTSSGRRSLVLVVATLCAALLLVASSLRVVHAVPPRVIVPHDSGVFHASPADSQLPTTAPYPVDGLIVRQMGTLAVGLPDVTMEKPKISSVAALATDAKYGLVAKFNNGGGLLIKMPVAALAHSTQMVDGKAQPFGLGLSLFYRFDEAKSQRVNGWLPLVSLGKLNQPWSLGVLLKSGVPVLARKHNDGTLFDLGAIAVGHQPTLRVDDGAWHHIVVNFSQAPNQTGCGGKPGATCAGRGWLRLHVDGAVLSEYLLTIGSDFRQVNIGSLSVTNGTYASQPNWLASPKTLLARGLIDDLMVYRRALTNAEISRLEARRRIGLVAQWPEFTPSLSGQTAATIPGAPGATQPSPLKGFKASTQPLFMAKKSASAPVAAGQFYGSGELQNSTWTFTSVIRPNGQKWFSQTAGWNYWAGIYRKGSFVYAACGTGKPGWAADTGKITAKTDIGYMPNDTDFHKVAWIQNGSTSEVFFNSSAKTLKCGELSGAFAAFYNRPKGTPATEPLADVARSLLFRRAMPVDELYATAFPGPIAWLNPTSVSKSALTSRSKSSLSAFWMANGKNPVKAPASGVLGEVSSASHSAALFCTSALSPAYAGGETRPFTIALRIKPIKVGSGIRDIPLAQRAVFGHPNLHDVDIRLVCDYGTVGCRVYLLTPGAKTGAQSGQWRVTRTLPWGKEATIVVSWPVTGIVATTDPAKSKLDVSPRVAINGVTENQTATNGTNHVIDLLPIWKKFGEHKRPATAGKSWMWRLGGDPSPHKLALLDVRVYPYAVQDVSSIGAKCAHLACGDTGRECAEANAANEGASGFCHQCDANHTPIAGFGAVERECRPKSGFYGACGQNSDCLSGACDVGTLRCKATNATKSQCVDYCSARGRRCDSAGGGTWRCGDCRSGYKRLPGYAVFSPVHPDVECTWNPTIKDGDLCSNSAQCMSALCRKDVSPGYNVKATQIDIYNKSTPVQSNWWPVFKHVARDPSKRIQKRCAIRDPSACTKQFRDYYQEPKPVYTPDCALTPANACGGKSCTPVPAYVCKDQCNSAYRERRWTLLSPQACEAVIANNLRLRPHAHSPRAKELKGDGVFKAVLASMKKNNFTINDVKTAFLRDTSNYDPNHDYAKLINAGVGRLLIAYASANQADKNKMAAKYGSFGRITDCTSAWAYNNPKANFVACEPKLQPLGAICPPPGESWAIKDEFCATNYCARDTKKCDYGNNPLLEPKPSAGNKDRQGKKDVKFGIV
ncbi:MAG: hypothetical protein KC502_19640, partial [Myxococcales bacterium]|nr:hypothetical protein [Myxococcales bacterium]